MLNNVITISVNGETGIPACLCERCVRHFEQSEESILPLVIPAKAGIQACKPPRVILSGAKAMNITKNPG